MTPRDLVRAIGIGRIVIGAGLALAPRWSGRGWLGADGSSPAATVLVRGLGARDVIIGAMALHTVDHPQVAPRWAYASAVADVADLAGMLAVRRDLPPRTYAVMALAIGAAVGSVVAAQGLGGSAGGPAGAVA